MKKIQDFVVSSLLNQTEYPKGTSVIYRKTKSEAAEGVITEVLENSYKLLVGTETVEVKKSEVMFSRQEFEKFKLSDSVNKLIKITKGNLNDLSNLKIKFDLSEEHFSELTSLVESIDVPEGTELFCYNSSVNEPPYNYDKFVSAPIGDLTYFVFNYNEKIH